MTPEDSARIDAWVGEQMREPWPLTSAQLTVIRHVLDKPAGCGISTADPPDLEGRTAA